MSWLALSIVLPLLAGSIALALVRLVRGPTVPDRVVSLDLIATTAVAMLGAMAIAFDQPVLLQPALVVALVGFLGTMAFAYYIEAE